MTALSDRVGKAVTDHAWAVVVVTLLVTAAFAVGVTAIEESSTTGGLSGDSPVTEAYDDVRANFTARGGNTTTMLIAASTESENVLSKESLLRSLRLQRSIRRDDSLSDTLADRRPTVGVANLVVRASIAKQRGGSREANATATAGDTRTGPTIDEQIAHLESMDDSEVKAVVERLLDTESPSRATRQARRLLPRGYEPGSTTTTDRLLLVTQETDGVVRAAPEISEAVATDQAAIRSVAKSQPGPETYRVFSLGLMSSQQSQAVSDSLGILGPLALAFVLVSLWVAYREPVDVVLGLVGVVVVLVWTLGTLGWLGMEFTQTMIAVPILLIGLSVDYALHVFVRYREERASEDVDTTGGGNESGRAMARALSGVGPALVLVTATTAIGFLANLTSPVGDIRAFGLVTAVGIVSTLLVFGLFVPAVKTLVAGALDKRGWDCTPSPPGSRGRIESVLGGGASIADRAPLVVLALALVITAGGVVGASQVDVSSSQELFMADEPPAWTDELPEAVRPGEYFLKENRRYVYSKFQSPTRQGYVLVEGNVTAPGTLDRLREAESVATNGDSVFQRPNGEPAVVTPLSAIRRVANRNQEFAATVAAADVDGDGIPDGNLQRVYDHFYAVAPDLAARTLHRTASGEYTAARIRVGLDGSAPASEGVELLTAVAERADGGGLSAVATGQPVVSKAVDDRLSSTMLESLGITLVVVLVLLAVVFRITEGAASLGVLTLVPVGFSVSWLLGTMALLDVPISVITALVGSVAVGLGVDYAIHVSERFSQELPGSEPGSALRETVTGTGGALLSSAVTTAAGFGVLTFSFLPGLRQFGLVLALGIVYAFLASVYVQPSLLALWARWGGGSTRSCESEVVSADD